MNSMRYLRSGKLKNVCKRIKLNGTLVCRNADRNISTHNTNIGINRIRSLKKSFRVALCPLYQKGWLAARRGGPASASRGML